MTDRAATLLLFLALLGSAGCYPYCEYHHDAPDCQAPAPPTCTTVTIAGRVAGGPQVTVRALSQDWQAWVVGEAVTDDAGRYAITVCENATLTLTPTRPGYRFTPASRAVAVLGTDVDGQDFEARALPTDHVAEFPLPVGAAATALLVGPDGQLWFTTNAGPIGRSDLAGHMTLFPISAVGTSLVAGPDGAVWFTEWGGPRLGRITPDGTLSEFGSAAYGATGLIVADDGTLWFLDFGASAVGHARTDGSFVETPVPGGALPGGLVAADDGSVFVAVEQWMETSSPDGGVTSTPYIGQVARVDGGGLLTGWPLPAGAVLGQASMALATDGGLWLTEPLASKLARFTPGAPLAELALPTPGAAAVAIVPGPDGALWFTEPSVGQIGRVTADGQVTEFRVAGPDAGLTELVPGPDGAVWFVEHAAERVGRLAPDGAVAEYELLTAGGDPAGLTVGHDGDAWLLERFAAPGGYGYSGGNLVRVTP